ncbi:hypothetical protein Tco_1446385 [Tanacetum coccineum]
MAPSLTNPSEQLSSRPTDQIFEPHPTLEIKQLFKMVGLSFRMFKGDRIRIRGILLGEMVQQEGGDGGAQKSWGMPMQDKMLLMQAQENGAVLDEEELLFLAGVDDEPGTAQSRFMRNLSQSGQQNFHKLGPLLHQSYLKIQSRVNTIHELKEKISRLTKRNSDIDPTFDLKALVSQNKDLTAKLNALHDHNECFRAENSKVKQHYKELYDSIKITRAKTTDQNNSLFSEIEHLKDQLRENSKCVTIPDCKPKMLDHCRFLIRCEPIPPHRLKRIGKCIYTISNALRKM